MSQESPFPTTPSDGSSQAPTAPTSAAANSANPFDPGRFRLSLDYDAANLGVKKVLTTVPCRKPNRQEFVRVRPGEPWRLETLIFEDKVNRESYLVDPSIAVELIGEIAPVCLFLAVNRHKDPFFWQVKLPGTDGRSNAWNESALKAAQLAETHWVRVCANMEGGCYDVFESSGALSDPEWPELSLSQLLEICFRDRLIRDANHVVIRRLRGEV